MVENLTLRRQFFIMFLRELFCYNEEHFLMNKTYYKNCFVREVARKCSVNNVLKKKSRQFLKENTYVGVSFLLKLTVFTFTS